MKITKNISYFISGLLLGLFLQYQLTGITIKLELKNSNNIRDKFIEFYNLLIHWLRHQQEGKKIAEYLIAKGYHNIAIYGMKELGELLLTELKNSKINVKYAIDRDADKLYYPIEIYTPQEVLYSVDAVIVTAIHYYDEIKQTMETKLDCPILSLYDIICGM